MQRERIIRVSNYDRTDGWMDYDFTLVGLEKAAGRNKYAQVHRCYGTVHLQNAFYIIPAACFLLYV